MAWWVGTSGWQYADWRGCFYPTGCPQRLWLEFYARRFATVENNNVFYRLPERATFEKWRSRVPAGFVMAVKASRFLTHIKRLGDPQEPVARLIDRAEGLGPGLGPVLLQLPPTLRADPELLEECLRQFPTWVRVAVEPRHPSWFDDRVRQVLERRGAALVWSDRKSRLLTPTWRTADWAYLRMHEGRALPWPRYGRTALAARVGQLAEAFPDPAAEVFVYFNNDPGGAAVEDAVGFTRAACRADRQVVVPVGVGSGR